MRIRSIKPEFWRSSDVSALAREDRLLFIGLWSYVDDNGVGVDKLASICADLFADDMERDARDTLATVSRGLQHLFARGLITRYKAPDGKKYLFVTGWEHQRIDRPAKPRYPLPTREDIEIRDTLATPSRDLRETFATGTGEQGNRGSEEKTCSSADAESESADSEPDYSPAYDRAQTKRRDAENYAENYAEFDAWYLAYPRKRGKGQAMKAYRAARKKADAATLLDALIGQAPTLAARGIEFCPYPATWLNGERWLDIQPDREPSSKPASDGFIYDVSY